MKNIKLIWTNENFARDDKSKIFFKGSQKDFQAASKFVSSGVSARGYTYITPVLGVVEKKEIAISSWDEL